MAELIADPFRAARLVLSLRRKGITDDVVLSALETVDRGAFIEGAMSDMGAEDCALPIPCGQSIPKPVVTARMLRALSLSPGKEDRVLLVGAGSGYTMALLSQTARHVYGIERYRALADRAGRRLAALKVDNVDVRHGDGLDGLAEHGPFDRILLAGAVTTVPAILMDQLAWGGVLVAPIEGRSGEQILRRLTSERDVSDEAMPDTISRLVKGAAKSL